jgi:hypothetical protein
MYPIFYHERLKALLVFEIKFSSLTITNKQQTKFGFDNKQNPDLIDHMDGNLPKQHYIG